MVPVALGLDFGTESVRAILVDAKGVECGSSVATYQHGQIVSHLPESKTPLPPLYALQDPHDWIEASATAIEKALHQSHLNPAEIVGIGVAFTSCTMLPSLSDGTPLCQLPELHHIPLAWPKLWKHHGALHQTQRMNQIAQQRNESFLARYGGNIGVEWFFPKLLETIEKEPEIASRAEVWVEAGDWFVWQLVGGPASELPRSTCQAGYKALWSSQEGYPSLDYLQEIHPQLANAAAHKMPGRLLSPGEPAGRLCPKLADHLRLPAGIAVSAAIIDAHAAVPGVGAAEPDTLVMVLGTSSCHMLNSLHYQEVPGIAGVVSGGILPGFYGYETGQAAVGDAFAWLLKMMHLDSFDEISYQARDIPPGSDGVMCLDWLNGCRTPLMDGSLKGAFIGLALHHKPAHLYRALLEASGFGLRWIVEQLREGGIPVEKFVATGGLPHHNPLVVQIYADILQTEIEIHPAQHATAVGAAVLGMLAAGPGISGFEDITSASQAMASVKSSIKQVISPRLTDGSIYDDLYRKYRALAEQIIRFQSQFPE